MEVGEGQTLGTHPLSRPSICRCCARSGPGVRPAECSPMVHVTSRVPSPTSAPAQSPGPLPNTAIPSQFPQCCHSTCHIRKCRCLTQRSHGGAYYWLAMVSNPRSLSDADAKCDPDCCRLHPAATALLLLPTAQSCLLLPAFCHCRWLMLWIPQSFLSLSALESPGSNQIANACGQPPPAAPLTLTCRLVAALPASTLAAGIPTT